MVPMILKASCVLGTAVLILAVHLRTMIRLDRKYSRLFKAHGKSRKLVCLRQRDRYMCTSVTMLLQSLVVAVIAYSDYYSFMRVPGLVMSYPNMVMLAAACSIIFMALAVQRMVVIKRIERNESQQAEAQ